ncbi:MAG: GNAT family N-acetyltransferase [Bacteroidia bacterium]|nr:GNAT family N-acetyltransferase [Bacteroidia bacterium]
MQISCKHFNQLHASELYEIFRLRAEVFVVEQNCPYQDADNKDLQSWHLTVYNDKKQLIAYSRIMPKGLSYPDYASIGRVVTSALVRKTGVGKMLMEKSIEECRRLFGSNTQIKIGAQTYLLKFYRSFGFIDIGEEYLEDEIPHTKMVLH